MSKEIKINTIDELLDMVVSSLKKNRVTKGDIHIVKTVESIVEKASNNQLLQQKFDF